MPARRVRKITAAPALSLLLRTRLPWVPLLVEEVAVPAFRLDERPPDLL
jgi:hypothetical protein